METQNEKIIQSWNENAGLWTNAVRTQSIESRHLVTNDAILQTVLACGGTRILDVGCGEGWLSHALMKNEKDVTGFDVSANLVEQGLSGKWSPMPWYFRTMSSWTRELASGGWNISALKEPLHPGTGKPASLILEARKK